MCTIVIYNRCEKTPHSTASSAALFLLLQVHRGRLLLVLRLEGGGHWGCRKTGVIRIGRTVQSIAHAHTAVVIHTHAARIQCIIHTHAAIHSLHTRIAINSIRTHTAIVHTHTAITHSIIHTHAAIDSIQIAVMITRIDFIATTTAIVVVVVVVGGGGIIIGIAIAIVTIHVSSTAIIMIMIIIIRIAITAIAIVIAIMARIHSIRFLYRHTSTHRSIHHR